MQDPMEVTAYSDVKGKLFKTQTEAMKSNFDMHSGYLLTALRTCYINGLDIIVCENGIPIGFSAKTLVDELLKDPGLCTGQQANIKASNAHKHDFIKIKINDEIRSICRICVMDEKPSNK